MTGNTQNALSESKLKERMNFAKMFERQEKQIKQTPHIQNLLTPSSENQEDKSMHSRIQNLEEKYNTDLLQNNLDLKLSKMELSMVKTLTKSLESLELKRRINFSFNPDLSDKKLVYRLCAAVLIAGLLAGIGLASGKKTIIQEKIVYKNIVKKPETRFVMTKYVNIRSKASTGASKLTTLAPNSIVKVLETHKGWRKIQYKNHLTEKSLIGWAYGENLKKIK